MLVAILKGKLQSNEMRDSWEQFARARRKAAAALCRAAYMYKNLKKKKKKKLGGRRWV